MIDGCQNISPDTPELHYVTHFYLSTMGSAWLEGSQVGAQEAVADQEEDSSREKYTKGVAAMILASIMGYDGSLASQTVFCMHYDAPVEAIYSIVEGILPLLQNPIDDDFFEDGVYKTKPYDREHIAAKWRDQYAILVEPAGESSSKVTVYRDLWISRQGFPYVRATSNGGNEAWILQTISKKL